MFFVTSGFVFVMVMVMAQKVHYHDHYLNFSSEAFRCQEKMFVTETQSRIYSRIGCFTSSFHINTCILNTLGIIPPCANWLRVTVRCYGLPRSTIH